MNKLGIRLRNAWQGFWHEPTDDCVKHCVEQAQYYYGLRLALGSALTATTLWMAQKEVAEALADNEWKES
jgi:hypothetical protein